MKESKMQSLRSFLEDWRMASVTQLRKEAELSLRVSEDALRVMLSRLRDAQMIRSCRMGEETVVFDVSLKKRADYIETLSSGTRASFLKRSGIHHHLLMVDLAQDLRQLNSDFLIQGNVLSESHSSTYSAHEEFFRKHAPDLTLSDRSNPQSLLCYLEVERTLKAEVRYHAKWSAYETDENVSVVLYWLYDRRLEKRLQDLMERFFRRSLGDRAFSIGTVLQSEFEIQKSNTPVKLYSIGQKKLISLQELLTQRLKRREVA